MADVLFHYTSCQAAQEIAISSRVAPGVSGKVYVTEGVYWHGAEAARLLAIPYKSIEMVLVTTRDQITGLHDARPVGPFLARDGSELRPGGGLERWTENEIVLGDVGAWRLATP